MEMNAVASESGSPASQIEGEGNGGMSKNARKRAAKQARMEELKPQRRLAEKIRRRERAAALSEGYTAGTLSETDRFLVVQRRQVLRDRKSAMKTVKEGGMENDWKGGVVIDLGFDGLMRDQEITSMTSQLSYVFSYNRTATRPFSTILHTSFSPSASPRLWEKMSKSNWEKWTRCYWWGEGMEDLSQAMSQGGNGLMNGSTSEEPGSSDPDVTGDTSDAGMDFRISHLTGPNLPSGVSGSHKLVYLSADSPVELTTLSEDEIYIVGGIVDRNRHKMLCQEKAEKLGIRTARLPIGTYLEKLPTRKVLTVNQVFAILVQYIAFQSWSAAFEAVIPQRKYQPGKKTKRKKVGATISEGAEPLTDEKDEDAAEADSIGEDEISEEAVMNT